MTPEDVRLVVAGGDQFLVVLPVSTAEGHWKLFTRSAAATESGY